MSSAFGFPVPGQKPELAATPGINPNAPDPRIPQGAPIGTPQMPAPQGAQGPGLGLGGFGQDPGDLSQASTGDRVNLGLQTLGEGLRAAGGESGPGAQIGGAIQRYQNDIRNRYEKRRQSFIEGLGVLEEFQRVIDNTPVADQERVKAQLRQRFIEYGGPGSEQLYDAMLGNFGISKSQLEAAQRSEGAKALIASGASGKVLFAFLSSDQFKKEALAFTDQRDLPMLSQRVQDLVNDPAMVKRARELSKDGALTPADIQVLNDSASTGPKGKKLSQSEVAQLIRMQGQLVGPLSGIGFKTDEEYERLRTAEMQDQFDQRRDKREGKPVSPADALKEKQDLEYYEALEAARAGKKLSERQARVLRERDRVENPRTDMSREALDKPTYIDEAIGRQYDEGEEPPATGTLGSSKAAASARGKPKKDLRAAAGKTYTFIGKNGEQMEIDFEPGDPEEKEFLAKYPNAKVK